MTRTLQAGLVGSLIVAVSCTSTIPAPPSGPVASQTLAPALSWTVVTEPSPPHARQEGRLRFVGSGRTNGLGDRQRQTTYLLICVDCQGPFGPQPPQTATTLTGVLTLESASATDISYGGPVVFPAAGRWRVELTEFEFPNPRLIIGVLGP